MTSLAIKGGTLVSARRSERADLAIDDGKVQDVGDIGSHRGEMIDASGLLVPTFTRWIRAD